MLFQSLNYGDGGFECQHGPSECLGNIVQDCSLHLLHGQSDTDKLAYVACEMDTEAGSNGKFEVSSEGLALPPPDIKCHGKIKVYACITGRDTYFIEKAMEIETYS